MTDTASIGEADKILSTQALANKTVILVGNKVDLVRARQVEVEGRDNCV